jgi:hypothetical protein
VHDYALALQYAESPDHRAELQARIVQLGGDPIAAALEPNGASQSAMAAGSDDTCDGAAGIALPWMETMNIALPPPVDRNFRVFDVPFGEEAWSVRIETIADPELWWSDTLLWLWGACEDGMPMEMIAHNDDKDPEGGDYMSLIEVECLLPGTYYIEVGGYLDLVEVPDFTFEVELTGACSIPLPDDYEPDETRELGALIGKPTSIPSNANGFGRYRSMTQARSLFPDDDVDHMHFDLNRPEWIQILFGVEMPNKWNGQVWDYMTYNEGDPWVQVFYGDEPDYGGFCNDPASGYAPYCRTAEDCPPPAGPPNPAFPTCVPIYQFTFGGVKPFNEENPLIWNHDYPGYEGFVTGPNLQTCLPPTQKGAGLSASASGGWDMRVETDPWFDPLYSPPMFNYELWMRPRFECNFEDEPNNGPFGARPISFDGTAFYGIQDASTFFGSQPDFWFTPDSDWYSFDTDELPWNPAVVTVTTDGFNQYAVDTALVLYVGPDDYGYYYDTGLYDDDGGEGYLSELEAVLPPANELLGNMVAEAEYFVDVTTFWLVPNFPYAVSAGARIYVPPLPPIEETEPNTYCETGNEFDISQQVIAEMNPQCDFDAFLFTITEPTLMNLETNGGDTAMLLQDANQVICCDDDTGGGPIWNSIISDACLPPGDYCVRIRPYDSSVTSPYTLDIINFGSCEPTDPPQATCDWAGYGACIFPGDQFESANGCTP